MTVKTFLTSLLNNELSTTGLNQTSLADTDPLTGKAKNQEGNKPSIPLKTVFTLVGLLNDGIQEVYTLFPFLRKKVYVRELENVCEYSLVKKYSRDGSENDPSKYIMDSKVYPYENDCIKILLIEYATGAPSMNTVYNCPTAIVNNITSIYDPVPVEGRMLDITYQARPKLYQNIDIYSADPVAKLEEVLSQEITIPTPLLLVLRLFIAFKVFMQNPVLSNGGMASEMYNAYTKALTDLQNQNLSNNSILYPNTLLEQKGFI